MDVVLPNKDVVVPKGVKSVSTDRSNCYENEEDVNLVATAHGSEHFRGIVELVHGFQELDDLGGMELVSGVIILSQVLFKH